MMAKKAHLFICAILLLCFSLSPSFSQRLDTMKADFVRVTTSTKGSAKVQGILYLVSSFRVIYQIQEPLRQVIVIDPEGMLVYYPDENKAWRFVDSQFSLMDLSAMITQTQKGDFGLADAGFSIVANESHEGTLITTWKPPKKLEKTIKTAKIETRDMKPYRLDLADPSRGYESSIIYGGYVSFGHRILPSRIEMKSRTRSIVTTETLTYSNHVFNAALPPEVLDFQLPRDARIEEVAF
jgi:outer membrane lipoprotein-sorting protein